MPQIDDQKVDSDLPPAYDALSHHRSANQHASTSASAGRVPAHSSDFSESNPNRPVLHIDKSLPRRPPLLKDTPPSPEEVSPALGQTPHARKNTSWFSYLPFASTLSAKRVRQSVLSVVNDLVIPPSRATKEGRKDVHAILASAAETCAEHKLSLSSLLQEPFVADHTPMYWTVVDYRQELLVALLVHSRPLTVQTISDIRRGCLASSNQALFHALRVCRPPFHKTDGIQPPSPRVAADNLLLGNRPSDDVYIQQATDRAFVVCFEIPLWQRRMKAIGQVSVEFIASGRMWSITFFSVGDSSPTGPSKKGKGSNSWHVVVSLLESSLPTFLDSRLVVTAPPPLVVHTPRLRETRSATFPSSRGKGPHGRSSMHGYDDGNANVGSSRRLGPIEEDGFPCSSKSRLPPPAHPLRGSPSSSRSSAAMAPPVIIRMGTGHRKLARRAGTGDLPETPKAKPATWSDQGVEYTNAAVASLEDGLASRLLDDQSPYLQPDGTLRGRLEASFVKSETAKNCIIC